MLGTLLDVWRSLTDPDRLIHLLTQVLTGWLGYVLLASVVFAETGLLVGLFLPGDSLLFTVGVVAGAGDLDIEKICALLTFFQQEYVRRTQAFYEKHGGKTLIYAKFVPIVRTFVPFMAGVGRMRYARFLSFNIFGGLGWVLSATLAGYYLGGIPAVRHNFEKVVIGIVLISVLPMAIHYMRSRSKSA